MRTFEEITSLAAARKGGGAALNQLLSAPKSPAEIAATPDARFLAEMTRAVFQAGFDWSLIDRKWPGFEAAFEDFDVGRWTLMSDDDVDRLAKDKRIVGNIAKIRSVGINAELVQGLAKAHRSAGAYFAASRPEDYFALVAMLKAEGSRLGGKTGQLFLRRMGVDALIYSDAVVSALKREGVVTKLPSSKRDIDAVREAVERWRAEGGRSLTEISQILAFSVES
ncbi:DNA-3-methyladenine glycosylase I [Amorphus sp. 3PC139-8]|uniref:DNA-3-methyladenine glycosylase I n=1 Tax=Amorphus sp. 3PC139-8 TaxID=2735676 RepID=UPI00345C7EB0